MNLLDLAFSDNIDYATNFIMSLGLGIIETFCGFIFGSKK